MNRFANEQDISTLTPDPGRAIDTDGDRTVDATDEDNDGVVDVSDCDPRDATRQTICPNGDSGAYTVSGSGNVFADALASFTKRLSGKSGGSSGHA